MTCAQRDQRRDHAVSDGRRVLASRGRHPDATRLARSRSSERRAKAGSQREIENGSPPRAAVGAERSCELYTHRYRDRECSCARCVTHSCKLYARPYAALAAESAATHLPDAHTRIKINVYGRSMSVPRRLSSSRLAVSWSARSPSVCGASASSSTSGRALSASSRRSDQGGRERRTRGEAASRGLAVPAHP